MLFLNLTHSLEEITNISEDYSEDELEVNDTLAMHEAAKHSHHAHSNGSLIEVPVDDHGHMLTDFEYRKLLDQLQKNKVEFRNLRICCDS